MYLVPFFWQFFISIKIFLILCTSCLCQHYIVFFKQLWRKIKQNDVKFLHPFLHLYFGHMMSFFFSYVFRTCQVPTKDPNSEYIAVVKPLKKINASLCDNNHVKHNLEQFFFYQVFAYQSFEFYSPGKANLQFSVCDTQILREIKFGNSSRSKSAILVILEALIFHFWENSTFESEIF